MMRAGFAVEDITPPTDCTLQGYDFRFKQLPPGNLGPVDPLTTRALVIDDGAGLAALLSLEVCILSTSLARQLRREVAERIGTDPRRVMICTTHTHSGPLLDEPSVNYRLAAVMPDAPEPKPDSPGQRYTETLRQRAVTAAARAAGLLVPVRLGVQHAPLGLGYDRRVSTPDGLRHCWNPQEQEDLHPGAMPDPVCTVAVFEQTSGPRRFVLWNLGAHPVVLGKTSRVVSADYPGRACREIENALPGSEAAFVLGAAGNCHPWIATQGDVEGVETVGKAAGSFVALLCSALRPGGEGLATAERTATFGDCEVDLAVWRLGKLRIAASPTELFGQLGANLRRRLGGPTFIATCANGWTGYWPAADAFDEGVYEVDSARSFGREPGDGEKLMEMLAAMAEELR